MNLGSLLRRHRKDKGLTLKAVSLKTGLSEGFLSQVENNVKSPSVDSLISVCQALDVDIGQVMKKASQHKKLYSVGRQEWSEVDLPHTGFATRRFCPPVERSVMDSALLFLEPGKSIPVRKNIKNGQEILCILEGSVELVHPEQNLTLTAGDAVHFWSEPKGQAITNRGETLAVALWVGTL